MFLPMPVVPLRFRTGWLWVGCALVAFIIYESLTRHPISVPITNGDKYGHVLAYATLMFWFAQLHAGARRVGCGVAFIAMGIAIEFLQQSTGYRSFEVADMVADAVGVGIGWLVAPPRTPHVLYAVERYLLPALGD